MSIGYIKLYRQLQDCEDIWLNDEQFDRRSAWIDLLLSANHRDKRILFNGKPIIIERGQLLTSVLRLSERWKWSRHKVSDFLNILECDGMILQSRDTKRTLITIVNYGNFQGFDGDEKESQGQQKDNKRTTKGQQKDINKNDKNIKNNNIYIYCASEKQTQDSQSDIDNFFEQIWKLYPIKKGKGQVSLTKKKALYKIGVDELTRCVDRFVADMEAERRDKKYWMHGSTFFNSGYVDYLDTNYGERGDVNGRIEQTVDERNNKQCEGAVEEVSQDEWDELMSDIQSNFGR